MAAADDAEQLYNDLRRLAVEDTRRARLFVIDLLDENHPCLPSLLERLAAPGDGRARQVVATVARLRTDKDRLLPHLFRWAEVEVDEFTREAIAGALAGVERESRAELRSLEHPDFVDTYRYVADRLCHKLRNGMSAPATRLRRLNSLAAEVNDDRVRIDILTTLAQLHDAFQRLSRLVEFDISDNYFQHKPVSLGQWLQGMNARYAAVHEQVKLSVREQGQSDCLLVRANDQLLDIAFWNLWNNSVQAVHATLAEGTACEIVVNVSAAANDRVEVFISDNGPGIPGSVADDAFQLAVSTHGEGRGRGLLEMQDAVRRLLGRINLVQTSPGSYRVQMSFPRSKQ